MTDATAKSNYSIPTYNRQPEAFVRGEGSYLFTADGHAYLDALSGIAVCNLGHAHPAITKAIAEQAATLVHTSNLFEIPWQQKAAELLCQISGMQQCFFANSGAEANEASIKLARMHAHKQGIENPAIIVMEKSFHGRTLATLSATGNSKVHTGFAPLTEGFIRIKHGDLDAIRAIKNQKNIVAILVEPIQGEGGIHIPEIGLKGYLSGLRDLCDQHNWLLMCDEVQTGNGRTGRYFAFQHANILPDVVSTAKGLGNGFPVGACLVSGKAVGLFGPGSHGTTYGGSPLACRTVVAVIETLQQDDMIAHAASEGAYIKNTLAERLGSNITVRGLGMMIGIELPKPCSELVRLALDEQFIINVTAEKVVRLLPPLNFSRAESDLLITKLVLLIQRFLQ